MENDEDYPSSSCPGIYIPSYLISVKLFKKYYTNL